MEVCSNIKIAYYSGTGNTAMVAKSFMDRLEEKGCSCTVEKITDGLHLGQNDHSLLLLLFPVHAFNAPEPVYKWLENLTPVNEIPTAIISVSGGGEVSPNTACRLSSIRRLKKKGYRVVYDTMIVMPSNCLVATKEPLAVLLLQVLSSKVNLAADDILSGRYRKSSPLLIDRLFSVMGELEKPAGRLWGRFIKPLADCNGCGWCAKNCPAGNISMRNGKPHFSNQCHWCLKCIYGCHRKVLEPKICKFIVIKEGYDLNNLLKKMPLDESVDVNQFAKGYLWSGVKKYLSGTRSGKAI